MSGDRFAGVGRCVIDELVALTGGHAIRRLPHPAAGRLPRLAAVARALHHLSEPAARLRRVQAIGIGGRSLHVVDLPPREVRTAHLPLLALTVTRQDERTLSGAHPNPYSPHDAPL